MNELRFSSGAISRDRPLELRGVRGREAISELFSFELLVRHDGPLLDEEIDKLFQSPCAIGLGPEGTDIVRGIVTEVRVLPHVLDRDAVADMHDYVLTMQPTVQLLTLGACYRVFQPEAAGQTGLTARTLVSTVLGRYDLMTEAACRLAYRDDDGRGREHAVQYGESDWDFLQRWLEHEGRFYWFEHDGPRERLVIGDANGQATRLDPAEIPYEEHGLADDGRERIFGWERVRRRPPARVAVVDYHSEAPEMRIGGRATVDERGFGTVVRYGEHLAYLEQASTIARLRAQRFACESETYSGRTNARRLRAGHVFELVGHWHDDGAYLVTEVTHRAGISPERPDADAAPYEARFVAIRIARQFRPALRTPWPTIHGVAHGHIAAEGDGTYAMMDEQGRYKVKLVFDLARTSGAAASIWIRKAQPYAGASEGSHHPLRKGTEVLVAFTDGDPDRPVIVGAVPNPLNPSPTTGANATQSVVETASGIRIELDDHQPRTP